MDIQLTQYGKVKYSQGDFNPKFYSFYDTDITYDGTYIGETEIQNEIQKQLSLREKFGSMNAEQQKAYDQLIASGKDLSSISKADLASQTDQVKKQQEM